MLCCLPLHPLQMVRAAAAIVRNTSPSAAAATPPLLLLAAVSTAHATPATAPSTDSATAAHASQSPERASQSAGLQSATTAVSTHQRGGCPSLSEKHCTAAALHRPRSTNVRCVTFVADQDAGVAVKAQLAAVCTVDPLLDLDNHRLLHRPRGHLRQRARASLSVHRSQMLSDT